MRRVFIILLSIFLLIACTGCGAAQPKEARLIVNGTEIENPYVQIYKKERKADIPLLTILRALGHDVVIQSDGPDSFKAIINDGWDVFDTTQPGYDIFCSCDVDEHTRRIVEDDIIISNECYETQLYFTFEAEISIDFRNMIVYVKDREDLTGTVFPSMPVT